MFPKCFDSSKLFPWGRVFETLMWTVWTMGFPRLSKESSTIQGRSLKALISYHPRFVSCDVFNITMIPPNLMVIQLQVQGTCPPEIGATASGSRTRHLWRSHHAPKATMTSEVHLSCFTHQHPKILSEEIKLSPAFKIAMYQVVHLHSGPAEEFGRPWPPHFIDLLMHVALTKKNCISSCFWVFGLWCYTCPTSLGDSR